MSYINNGNGLLYYSNIDVNKSDKMNCKIAAFDLDDTLITPLGRNKFPKDKFDWKPLYKNIPFVLEILQEDYVIVIFTNQKKLSVDDEFNDFFDKVHMVMKSYNVKTYACYAAIKDNYYRKPMTGMYDKFISDHNIDKNKINKESFYCGDAASRSYLNMFKRDYSASDYYFAFNIGLVFKTPENFFNQKEDISYIDDYYTNIGIDLWFCKEKPLYESEEYRNIIKFCDRVYRKKLIIMVGYPACGKSRLALHLGKKYIKNDFVYLSNDVHSAMFDKFKKYVLEGKNLIIDNTNMDLDDRMKLYNITPDYDKLIIYFDFPIYICKHLNYYRTQQNPSKKLIPDVVYNKINKYKTDPYEDLDLNIEYLCIETITYNMIVSYLNGNNMKMYINK